MATIRQTATIPRVTPRALYDAFLDSRRHAAMTGAKAKMSSRVGGRWTAWDESLSGTNLELVPGKKIVQAWRGSDFPGDHHSRLTLTFTASASGTRVTLVQTDVPDELVDEYAQGWRDYYWAPMKEHFRTDRRA